MIYDTMPQEASANKHNENISGLAQAIQRIRPNHVQVYSVARMPAEFYVVPLGKEQQEQILHDLITQVDDPAISISSYT
jgi:wyosine [tRNA(Phe)-imidazoG37] synthetase (radical SAM superfamily)